MTSIVTSRCPPLFYCQARLHTAESVGQLVHGGDHHFCRVRELLPSAAGEGRKKKKKAPSKHRCWAGGTQPDANICIRHTQLFALFLVLLREPLHLHWLHKVAFRSAKATSAEEFRRAPTVLLLSPHRCSYVLACCSSFWGSRASASSGKKNGRPFLCRCG